MQTYLKPCSKQHGAVLLMCTALMIVAIGCESPAPREEVVGTVSHVDYRRRPNERVYAVPITSVHAVVGNSEEHCWIEREQVSAKTGPNVGGAIAGAVIGGIIGHQIGDGRGNDLATAGGAVAGGAIGAHAGRSNRYEDVKHCETVASTVPDYWDVTYEFRGVRHHVQMLNPPGTTMLVNGQGDPRV